MGAGDVQWCKGYQSNYNWSTDRNQQVMKTHDGNYVVLAVTFTQDSYVRPFLMKTDQNGDTLWTRSAGAGNFTYETRNLLACSDGIIALSSVILRLL